MLHVYSKQARALLPGLKQHTGLYIVTKTAFKIGKVKPGTARNGKQAQWARSAKPGARFYNPRTVYLTASPGGGCHWQPTPGMATAWPLPLAQAQAKAFGGQVIRAGT